DTRAEGLVSRLLVADIGQVPQIIQALDSYRDRTDKELAGIAQDPTRPPPERLRASLALVPVDERQLPFLLSRLLIAEPEDLLVIRGQLEPWRDRVVESRWGMTRDPGADMGQRFRAATGVAAFVPRGARWGCLGGLVGPVP